MFALTLIMALAVPSGDDGRIQVRCHADAQIRGTEVLLRDLAEIKTADPELTARLMTVSFGSRPAFGHNRVVSRQDVLLRLAREGLATARLDLLGANEIVLHPLVTRMTSQEILDAAEPVLRATLDLEGGDIEFEPIGKVSALKVPPGRVSLDLRARLAHDRISYSSATINVAVLVDGEEFQTVRVPYRLRRYEQVLTAVKPIRKGTPLDEAALELRRLEAPQGTSPHLRDHTAINGKVAARDIQSGSKLTLVMLRDPAVVLKGELVNLVAQNGRIQVATKAVALRDGAAGESILVRNVLSDKILPARVHGRGLVVVHANQDTRRQP